MNDIHGQLIFHLCSALLFTLPASATVLAWYGRQLRRQMTRSLGGDLSAPLSSEQPAAPTPPVVLDRSRVSRVRRRLIAAYGAAALASAGVATFLFLRELPEVRPAQIAISLYIFSWPLVAMMPTVLVLPRGRRWRLVLGYVLLGATLLAGWTVLIRLLGRTDALTPMQAVGNFLGLLFMCAAAGTVLITITGHPRWRAVSPMVLAALVLFFVTALVTRMGLDRILDLRALHARFSALGQPTSVLVVLAAIPAGGLCWLLMRWLARHYQRKSFSDLALVADSWWFIACVAMAPPLSDRLGFAGVSGLIAFVAYRVVLGVMLRRLPLPPLPGQPPRLLLLRVFRPDRRSEAMFDEVVQIWRLQAPVHLLGGTDLASRCIDPAEIISFLGGEVQELFVRDRADLTRRLANLDDACDPDGRYRVNELFCDGDTWKTTLQALLARSEVVLMDLRGFSGSNAGCSFELEVIGELGRAGEASFVVDAATDLALAESLLNQKRPAEPVQLSLVRADRRLRGAEVVRQLEGLL